MFGNVNVDYKPCKSSAQLERAADYILGRLPEQVQSGVVKTSDNLYWGINCDRDNFVRDVMITRSLFGKKQSGNANLAFKMSISFHPDDNDKIDYKGAFQIAKEFADRFMKGYEVLFAVHTDTEHIHVHFLVGNCHTETGKAYRRSQKDLYDMCEFFGGQCMERGLTNSVREHFYNHDISTSPDKEKVGEQRMKAKGKETFKDELREVILEEIADPNNLTLDDVVNALMRDYNVECRVKGNTISYRHPNFTDKSGKLAAVRGSKLGEKYTVKGIRYELEEKQRRSAEREACIHLTGADESGVRTAEKPISERVYITGNRAGAGAGNTTDRGRPSGKYQQQVSVPVGREHQKRTAGRAGQPADCVHIGDVPDLERLFAEYQRRNGEDSRPRNAEPEHTETVRRKRKGIDH